MSLLAAVAGAVTRPGRYCAHARRRRLRIGAGLPLLSWALIGFVAAIVLIGTLLFDRQFEGERTALPSTGAPSAGSPSGS
jgi:hypothetical protein